ncbi:ComEC/Rec2 family competence protein [Leptospira ognonensis]|uniref:ComEC/Rec2 family competence protein n=1 Tax=Leptospira ognonensis TaxID=2484945 RepID=A0A4R9JV08_9LEPT|nr:ComEC/Rec2 family competence protein [Leptospira ognonensis]
MRKGKLPRIFPVSHGGILSLGICFAATFSKLNFKGQNAVSIIIDSLALLMIVGIFSFLSKNVANLLKLFFLGAILFHILNLNKLEKVEKRYSNRDTISSIAFSNQISELLLRSGLTTQSQAITKGLVLGSSRYLPDEIKIRAREGGILHLFAASGLHLGIFIGFALFIFKKIFFFQRALPYFIALLLGFLYLFLLGFPVSFLRAYCFAVYSLLGILAHKKTQPADTLSYASATIAIFLPSDFLSVGFLLSFSAVFGIFYLKPALDIYFFPNQNRLIKDNLTLSLACTYATFPILVYYFHAFSFGSFWINLAVVPFASLLLPLLYLNLSFEWLFGGPIVSYLWIFTDYVLGLFMKLLKSLTNSISFFFQWQEIPVPIVVYFLLIFFAFFCSYLKHFFFQNLKEKRRILGKELPMNRLYSIFLFLLFFGFQPFGIWYFNCQNDLGPKFQAWFHKGNSFLRFENTFYFLGNCYAESFFKKVDSELSLAKIDTIYIEHANCKKLALQLRSNIERRNGKEVHFFTVKPGAVLPVFFNQGESMSALIRYDGNKRNIFQLMNKLKEIESVQGKYHISSANYLVLDFPVWSKEKPEDWKKYQKLLGISYDWKIMSVEELLAGQVHNTNRNSKLSFH